MMVNVTIPMELERVPHEVRKLISKIDSKHVCFLFEEIAKELDEQKISNALDNIRELRLSLAKTDEELSSYQTILAHWEQTNAARFLPAATEQKLVDLYDNVKFGDENDKPQTN